MKRIVSLCIILLAAISCTNEIKVSTTTDELNVSLATTKVQITDGCSAWNNGDKVSVFYRTANNEKWTFSGEDGAKSGVLKYAGNANRSYTSEKILSIYPYDANATLTDNVLTTEISAEQTYKGDGHVPSLMTSSSESTDLYFQYASALLGMNLIGQATITSITLEGLNGESIAGECSIDFSGESPSFNLAGTETKITLATESGDMEISGNQTILFAIAPTYFENGYKFTISYSDGTIQECKSTMSIKMDAGHMRLLDCKVNDTKTFTLTFSEDGTRLSPVDFKGTGKVGYGFTDLITGNVIGPFYMFEDDDHVFPIYMYIQSKYKISDETTVNTDSFRITGGAGLKFGGRKGDWMQIPPIEGYVLSSVCVQSASLAPACITTAPESGEASIVSGGEERAGSAIFNLEDTEEGASYRYTLQDDVNSSILEISFVYIRI